MSAESRSRALLRSDAVAGVLVTIIAAVFFYGAWKLRAGTLDRMGPGYVPIAMAIFLFAWGVVLTLQAFVAPGRARISRRCAPRSSSCSPRCCSRS